MGTEHYEINAYEAAIRLADALGAEEVAGLLRANLDQEVAALEKLGASRPPGATAVEQRRRSRRQQARASAVLLRLLALLPSSSACSIGFCGGFVARRVVAHRGRCRRERLQVVVAARRLAALGLRQARRLPARTGSSAASSLAHLVDARRTRGLGHALERRAPPSRVLRARRSRRARRAVAGQRDPLEARPGSRLRVAGSHRRSLASSFSSPSRGDPVGGRAGAARDDLRELGAHVVQRDTVVGRDALREAAVDSSR